MSLVELLSKLISFRSITPNDDGCLEFITKILLNMGFKCKKLDFGNSSNRTKNIYAHFSRGSGTHFCFAGHVDVVPPGDNWKSDPFKATKKNGYIFGRGACDMKSSIAAFVNAVNSFLKKTKDFKGTISLILTSDEEGDAELGTKKVIQWLKKEKIKIDFCLVGEPTSRKKIGDMAKIGRRGSINCNLTVKGKQGHVAYPEKARNPITDLIRLCSELKKPFDKGNAFFPPTNLEITSIDTENKITNLIPEKVTAKFNIRFNNSYNSKTLIKTLKKRLDNLKTHYELSTKISGESFLNQSDILNTHLEKSIFEITKENVEFSTSGGTSDARFISKICPVVEFGSVGETMHQIDEKVKIKDLDLLSKIYIDLLDRVYS